MAERYHRAQILLKPSQYEALRRVAASEERSISDVAREVVALGLHELRRIRERKLEALDDLSRLRGRLSQRIGVVTVDLVAETRAERERRDETLSKGGC